jgi:hypothetical protein
MKIDRRASFVLVGFVFERVAARLVGWAVDSKLTASRDKGIEKEKADDQISGYEQQRQFERIGRRTRHFATIGQLDYVCRHAMSFPCGRNCASLPMKTTWLSVTMVKTGPATAPARSLS